MLEHLEDVCSFCYILSFQPLQMTKWHNINWDGNRDYFFKSCVKITFVIWRSKVDQLWGNKEFGLKRALVWKLKKIKTLKTIKASVWNWRKPLPSLTSKLSYDVVPIIIFGHLVFILFCLFTSFNKSQSPLLCSCPNPDDSYRTKVIDVDTPDLAFPSHYKRFVFRMFTFVNRASSPPGQKTKLLDVEVIEPVRQKVRDCARYFHTLFISIVSIVKASLLSSKHLNCGLYQVYIHCDCSVCVESSSNNCMTSCARKSE